MTFSKKNKIHPSLEELIEGTLNNDRVFLAKAITLVESSSIKHREEAKKLLNELLPHTKDSIRIGISGIPGAGKSTLIETLGLHLINEGLKVAVLTIDPSSYLSKGSILADKTRMEKLARNENCFIRPSPTGGILGGISRKTRESIVICEAAGYDAILIETVGVGQNEISVRSMVDFFLLVLIAGGGDDIQGMKKGIIEITDAIFINKAEGENQMQANLAKSYYEQALNYFQNATPGWQTRVMTGSALYNKGINKLWETIKDFISTTKKNDTFFKRRQQQAVDWTIKLIEDGLRELFFSNKELEEKFNEYKGKILSNEILPTIAAEELLGYFQKLL